MALTLTKKSGAPGTDATKSLLSVFLVLHSTQTISLIYGSLTVSANILSLTFFDCIDLCSFHVGHGQDEPLTKADGVQERGMVRV